MASLSSFPCPSPHKSFPFHHSSAASKLSCSYISKGEASKIGPWWMRELFVPVFEFRKFESDILGEKIESQNSAIHATR